MAVTVFEVFGVIVCCIVLAYAIWFFVLQLNRKKFLDNYVYSRGANAWQDKTTVNLKCGPGREICIFRATQVCSGNDPSTPGYNFEIPDTDPIASGNAAGTTIGYGEFNPDTTVDLTESMSEACNGKNQSTYTIDTSVTPFPNGKKCDPNNVQLLATYSCVPAGGTCTNVNSSN